MSDLFLCVLVDGAHVSAEPKVNISIAYVMHFNCNQLNNHTEPNSLNKMLCALNPLIESFTLFAKLKFQILTI